VIEQFIEATRGSRSRAMVNPLLAATYEFNYHWITQRLSSMISSGIPADMLTVVYTPAAQAETVEIGGKRVIIYDQYLGQVMNRLNRLLFDQAEAREVDAYLCKLFALHFLASGRPAAALEYALIHVAWSDRLRKADPASAEERMRFAAVQECFVLAHEIAHCIVRDGGRPAAEAGAWWAYVTRIEAEEMDEARANMPTDRIHAVLKRDFLAAADRRFGPATGDELTVRESDFEEIYYRQVFPEVETNIQMLIRVLSKPHLAEECLCDAIALNVTAQWAKERLRMPANQALPDAIVGLHHLRLLGDIDRYASVHSGTPGNIMSSKTETQTRLSLARLSARSYAWLPSIIGRKRVKQLLLGRKDHAPGLHKALIFENERYSAVIRDQLEHKMFQGNVNPAIEGLRTVLGEHNDTDTNTDTWTRVLVLCNLAELVDPVPRRNSSLLGPSMMDNPLPGRPGE